MYSYPTHSIGGPTVCRLTRMIYSILAGYHNQANNIHEFNPEANSSEPPCGTLWGHL